MTICIIPARGGSKRIPRKNIKDFLGKPIIAYSIEAALRSERFDNVIVSTDDSEIAAVAQQYGAEVPFVRPADLSDDFSTTTSVVKHALGELQTTKSNETVCCLYATAPFVSAEILRASCDSFEVSGATYCLSVTTFPFPIQRALRIAEGSRLCMFEPENADKRSQDLEEAYHDAGQFCWGTASAFVEELPLYSEWTLPYLLPRHLVQDVDSTEDWEKAEAMFKVNQQA